VRRLVNTGALGDTAQQVEILTTLALDYGFSVFIVPGDDPAALEAFAAEVAPRGREAVTAARHASG
jgi:SpoU rRNA methylase family enzyme